MAIVDWQAGTFSGKVGGIVGAQWRGINTIRGVPHKTKPDSPKQAEHKARYQIAYKIISPIYESWIKKYYKNDKITPANMIIKNLNPFWWKSEKRDYYVLNYPNMNTGITISAVREIGSGTLNRSINNFKINGANPEDVTETLFYICYPDNNFEVNATIMNGLPEFPYYFSNRSQSSSFYLFCVAVNGKVSNCLNVYDLAGLPQPKL